MALDIGPSMALDIGSCFFGRKTEYDIQKYKTCCVKDLATLTPVSNFFCVRMFTLFLKSIGL